MTALLQATAALRAEVQSHLPERAFLRIDRTGRALYAASADEAALNRLHQSGWLCVSSGQITLLSPSVVHLIALRGHTPPHPLTAHFADRPADPAILPLLTALLRATELPPAPSAQRQLDKQLRQAMAVALRENRGGGLEICFALFQRIQNPTT